MANELKNNSISETLITDLKQIILQARQGAYAAVNACMISTYWKIGQRIVEEEQQGKTRAEYGKGQRPRTSQQRMLRLPQQRRSPGSIAGIRSERSSVKRAPRLSSVFTSSGAPSGSSG